MAAVHKILWAQKHKINLRNNVQVILLQFKMATTSRLFKYICDHKKL